MISSKVTSILLLFLLLLVFPLTNEARNLVETNNPNQVTVQRNSLIGYRPLHPQPILPKPILPQPIRQGRCPNYVRCKRDSYPAPQPPPPPSSSKGTHGLGH